MHGAYYNDNDPGAAQWLRNLIKAGLIPAGDVDDRSISEVAPEDLKGYKHVHLFAGIGGWAYALSLAGAEDLAWWTCSCPCQPFSVAGKRKGTGDKRHLWPEAYRLIKARKPARLVGEQVASKDGRQWLAGVRSDLEDVAYDVGAADYCSAGVSAPHIRQRLYWVADTLSARRTQGWPRSGDRSASRSGGYGCELADSDVGDAQRHGGSGELAGASGEAQGEGCERKRSGSPSLCGGEGGGGLGNPSGARLEKRQSIRENIQRELATAERASGWLGDANDGGRIWGEENAINDGATRRWAQGECFTQGAGWGDYWLSCADEKSRRVEPSIPLLAHGVSARVAKLRGIGNAIQPQVAARFIEAYLEATR